MTEFLCIASFFAFLRALTGHFFAFFTPLSAFDCQADDIDRIYIRVIAFTSSPGLSSAA
jgi:hypothetical protein